MAIEWMLFYFAQGFVSIQPISVCELAISGRVYDGKRVRLVAEYVTDRRHGAYFIDKGCPRVSVAQGIAAEDPKDPSVVAFDDAVGEGALSHKLAKFKVDVSARYDASDKGSLIIEKVWSYKKVP